MEENLLEKVTDLTLYTGTYGRKRCTCSCIGCTQESYGKRHEDFQGTMEQIDTISKKLPNLKTVYFLGNPDISVDTEFCNLASKKFTQEGKKVMYSTSGYNAMETLNKLIDGIEPQNIECISYSVDTLNVEKFRYLKGNKNISIKEIEKAIKYCNENKIKVKIQPTLWDVNQDDYKDIIEYFSKKFNIDWFTFHAGSFESLQDRKVPLKHIRPEKWRKIAKEINEIAKKEKLKILVPKIFLNEEEYKEYKENAKLYCNNGGTGMQIWMQKDGLKATFCPILAETKPNDIVFDFEEEKPKLVKTNNECLVCTKCIDDELKKQSKNEVGIEFLTQERKLYNICRYYSYREDYR